MFQQNAESCHEFYSPPESFESERGFVLGTVSKTYRLPEGYSCQSLEKASTDFEMDRRRNIPMHERDAKRVESLYQDVLNLNPELKEVVKGMPYTFELGQDILRGICSKFNPNDMRFYIELTHSPTEKQMRQYHEHADEFDKEIGHQCEWVVSPKTEVIIKQALNQKHWGSFFNLDRLGIKQTFFGASTMNLTSMKQKQMTQGKELEDEALNENESTLPSLGSDVIEEVN